jgi:hypothetical protein
MPTSWFMKTNSSLSAISFLQTLGATGLSYSKLESWCAEMPLSALAQPLELVSPTRRAKPGTSWEELQLIVPGFTSPTTIPISLRTSSADSCPETPALPSSRHRTPEALGPEQGTPRQSTDEELLEVKPIAKDPPLQFSGIQHGALLTISTYWFPRGRNNSFRPLFCTPRGLSDSACSLGHHCLLVTGTLI